MGLTGKRKTELQYNDIVKTRIYRFNKHEIYSNCYDYDGLQHSQNPIDNLYLQIFSCNSRQYNIIRISDTEDRRKVYVWRKKKPIQEYTHNFSSTAWQVWVEIGFWTVWWPEKIMMLADDLDAGFFV